MLIGISDPFHRDELLGEMACEYFRDGLGNEELLVVRERVAINPNAAPMWLSLALTLSARKDCSDDTRTAVAKGLSLARQAGALVRHALICQGDVARTLNDSHLFQQALRDLIAEGIETRESDRELNDALLRNLPERFCPLERQLQYRKHVAAFAKSELQ